MLRQVVLAAAGSDALRTLAERAPVARSVVHRFVPGADLETALAAVAELAAQGLWVSLDRLGEDVTDPADARATADAYRLLFARLADTGLGAAAEASVKLTAVGLGLPDGRAQALANAREIAAAARDAGTTITIDMEDHTLTDVTLETVRELRVDFPGTGAVVQAYLHRTEADCRDLATPGSRVRLCKGAYDEPASVAFASRPEVDASYVRCLEALFAGGGRPLVATHDPRLIAIADALATRHGRTPADWEYQMLYGIRPEEQRRLVAAGHDLRVYLPYGTQWWGYFMRRLAERPANATFFLRSLATRG
jgi:proline dehydrogenase